MSASNNESPFNREWLGRMVGDPKPAAQMEVRRDWAHPGYDAGAQAPQFTDHEVAQCVNELRRIALEYGGSQQLRERIAHYIKPILVGERRP